MYSTIDKLMKLFNTGDGSCNGDTNASSENYYIYMFKNNRSMFITCELKDALEQRDMESTFGLLPFPKYDENQDAYQTAMNSTSCFLTVPVNVDNPSRVATILDALTYESYESVLPVYYDVTLSQKGLRNEDSIKMLDIVRAGRGIEFSQVLGITTDFSSQIRTMITGGNNTASSIIAANKEKVEQNLTKLLDKFE